MQTAVLFGLRLRKTSINLEELRVAREVSRMLICQVEITSANCTWDVTGNALPAV